MLRLLAGAISFALRNNCVLTTSTTRYCLLFKCGLACMYDDYHELHWVRTTLFGCEIAFLGMHW
jgi:hypothetical protein